MPENHQSLGNRSESGAYLRPGKDEALDRERINSMADEGGIAAAVADLREQLDLLEKELLPKQPWTIAGVRGRTLLLSAAALGAASALMVLAIRYRGGYA